KILLFALALSQCVGCGNPPQVSRDNRRLIESLRTAISTQRADWLEMNSQKLEEQFAAGRMSEAEHQAFAQLVAQAREGKWSEAQEGIVRLAQAQRPTPEDLERLRAHDRK